MKIEKLKNDIENIWKKKDKLGKSASKKDLKAIHDTINFLDSGILRVAEKVKNNWLLNQWIKKAVLLSFQVL